uniref:Uncharacterized protein n=1 Tax=Glossina brevipalpis TaxID=37001 RepID=A0A1A9WYD8_9MUSC
MYVIFRRKKKCIRYMEAAGGSSSSSTKEERFNELDDVDGPQSDDDEENDHEHLGGASSVSGDDIHKSAEEEDNESLNQSLSSPGCLSGLSSLQSPSTSLASPLNLLTSPAIPTNPLLNTFQSAGTEQTNMQGQSSAHILALHGNQLSGNCSSLNQHLQQQQQQPLSKLSQAQLHGPQQHQATNAGTLGDRAQSYASETNNSGTTALLPTLSTSSTSSVGSASGYGTSSSASNYTSNSATSSPSSLSDRMVRSLLNNNSAMLLGNRVSNLAMGLGNQQGKAAVSNNNRCLHEFTKTIDSDLSGNSNSTTPETTNTVPVNNIALTSPAPLNAAAGRCNSTTSLSNSYKQLLHSGGPVKISLCSSRTTTSNTHNNGTINPASNQIAHCINEAAGTLNLMPLQRNPIGANPRDINNPLSINQLTKRPREQSTSSNSGKGNDNSSNNNNRTSNMCIPNLNNTPNMSFSNQYQSHHRPPSPSLPSLPPLPTHHTIFGGNSNSFTQHFQRQFGHHLITAAVAAGHIATVPSNIPQPVTTNTTIISNNNNNTSSKTSTTVTMSNVTVSPGIGAPVNVDIVRRSTSDTSTSNKNSCGAISVT